MMTPRLGHGPRIGGAGAYEHRRQERVSVPGAREPLAFGLFRLWLPNSGALRLRVWGVRRATMHLLDGLTALSCVC